MSDKTTAPALPDARTELRGALGNFEYALTTAKHRIPDARRALTAAFAALDVAICDAIAAADTAGEARGRAAALAEVDAALDRLHDHADITFVAIDRAVIGRPVPRWSCECLPNRGTYSVEDTPTAAILAAAAALGGDA